MDERRQVALTLTRADVSFPRQVGPAADSEGVPPINDGETLIGPYEPLGGNATLSMPTIGLSALLAAANDRGFRLLMPREWQAQRLSVADGTHFLRDFHVVRLKNGSEAIRTKVLLLTEQHAPAPFVTWVDLVPEQLAIICERLDQELALRDAAAQARRGLRQTRRPTWAGSRSFQPFIERLDEGSRYLVKNSGELPARPPIYDAILFAATDAHLVKMDPEQVNVLPEWESWRDMADYAAEATLPFDPVYFDFEGAGGYCAHVQMHTLSRVQDHALLRGALVWRDRENSALIVAPYGWPTQTVNLKDDMGAWSYDDIPGMVVLGEQVVKPGQSSIAMDVVSQPGTSAHARAFRFDEFTDGVPVEGFMQLTMSPLDLARNGVTDEGARGWGIMLAALTAKVIAAISITEAAEVEIVDVPLERRDRKRAEKRGWKIAQQVMIRPPKRYRDRIVRPGDPDEARYSHRFWVRAHVAHFPVGTRVADARPDLVKPCTRTVNPCGMCRVVKRPAYIKGPADKPIVLKSLVTKKKRPEPVA